MVQRVAIVVPTRQEVCIMTIVAPGGTVGGGTEEGVVGDRDSTIDNVEDVVVVMEEEGVVTQG